MRGKPGTVATLLAEDRAAMLPLPARPFEARRTTDVSVDSLSLVRFDTNSYSVPTKYAHRTVKVVATVSEVRIVYEDRLIARHPRCWGREQSLFDPIHYLALLERKPGGFDFARPLEKWDLPECLRGAPPPAGGRRAARDAGVHPGAAAAWRRTPWPSSPTPSSTPSTSGSKTPTASASILEHRADRPTELFRLDGRPHLAGVRVPPTDVSAYASLLAAPDVGVAS